MGLGCQEAAFVIESRFLFYVQSRIGKFTASHQKYFLHERKKERIIQTEKV